MKMKVYLESLMVQDPSKLFVKLEKSNIYFTSCYSIIILFEIL